MGLAEKGSSVLDPYEEKGRDCLYYGTVSLGNAERNGAEDFVGGVRIME